MKQWIITACLIVMGLGQNVAQISFSQVAKPIVKVDTMRYDSTVNYVEKSGKALLGQELYLIPKAPEGRKYGYHDFYASYENTESDLCEIKNYEQLAGKTFIVEEILPPFKPKTSYDKYDSKEILKLKEKGTDNIYYYKYPRFYRGFRFIVLGFYEKEKKACIGKTIVLKPKNWRESTSGENKPIYDCQTGEEVKIDINDLWTIQELTVEEQYYTLSYILTNNKGETVNIDLYSINDYHRSTGPCALRYDDTLKEIKTQHPEYYKAFMQGHIVAGMTEEMVRMAWGNPKEIRNTSYGEFWHYGEDETLHFEKGILEGFN